MTRGQYIIFPPPPHYPPPPPPSPPKRWDSMLPRKPLPPTLRADESRQQSSGPGLAVHVPSGPASLVMVQMPSNNGSAQARGVQRSPSLQARPLRLLLQISNPDYLDITIARQSQRSLLRCLRRYPLDSRERGSKEAKDRNRRIQ